MWCTSSGSSRSASTKSGESPTLARAKQAESDAQRSRPWRVGLDRNASSKDFSKYVPHATGSEIDIARYENEGSRIHPMGASEPSDFVHDAELTAYLDLTTA